MKAKHIQYCPECGRSKVKQHTHKRRSKKMKKKVNWAPVMFLAGIAVVLLLLVVVIVGG